MLSHHRTRNDRQRHSVSRVASIETDHNQFAPATTDDQNETQVEIVHDEMMILLDRVYRPSEKETSNTASRTRAIK